MAVEFTVTENREEGLLVEGQDIVRHREISWEAASKLPNAEQR